MKKLLALSRSRLLLLLFCLGFFAMMLLCNHWTDLIADDYRYCFSYLDDTRIESVAQIFPSMAAHRQSMNGRVVPHFLVQLFLMLPKGFFDVVNAFFFAGLIWLLHKLAVGKGLPNPVLACALFFAFWTFQPDFGQVFLWLTGSVNYLWCGVFSLLWLLPLAKSFRDDIEPGKAVKVLYVLFSFPVGAYSENGTVALVATWLAFTVVDWFWFKKRPALWKLLALVAMLAGFAYMMAAPAETVNKSAEMTFSVLLGNFVETGRMYLRFWPLLLCFPPFYALAVYHKVDLKTRLLSLVLLFGSLAGQFVLTFAMYCAGRSMHIALVLLLAADAVLLSRLYDLPGRNVLIAALLAGMCFMARGWFVGLPDIRDTHYLLQYNEDFITECAVNGEREVQLPRPYAKTSWSALEGLAYLNTEDPDDWPNVYMAKYYGVDKVIGY
ncbi:MAG: hypothetical protein IJ649_08545 [Oscillospiraceae bacterium]|nr:hypothetical protein [Oscillospiraceae bacterium]